MFLLKKFDKIAKRVQSSDSIQTYAYGTNKYLTRETEKIDCNDIIKQYKQ